MTSNQNLKLLILVGNFVRNVWLKIKIFVPKGCGNGMMLIELAREGFTNLTGVDYSPKAIDLSQNIAKDQEIAITYKVADLLDAECCVSLGRFDIVHDKGKFTNKNII